MDGRLVIGEDEISLLKLIACMNSRTVILVGTTESLQIFRDGKEISSSAHETGIESISGKGDYAVCIDGLGRLIFVDSKGEQNPINETSVLFAKVGHRIAIATESGSVSTYSQDGIKLWERPMRGDVGGENNRNWLEWQPPSCSKGRSRIGSRR